MLRAPRPEIVSLSILIGATGVVGRVSGVGEEAGVCAIAIVGGAEADPVSPLRLPIPDPPLPGRTNNASAIGTFASIFVKVTFCRFGFPFAPFSIEKGRYQPLTLL